LAKLTLRYAHASLPFPVVGKKRHHLLSLCSSFGPCDSPSPVGRRSLVEVMATGAPDSQARFGQSVKGLLTEKVNTCGTDVIALTKQVLKGSRSSELLGQAARNMVLQEDAILHSEDVRNNFCYDLGFICTVWLQGKFKKNGNNHNTSSIP
ncbi:hypothetical protein EI555_012956, partial [Monodon monoceros]